MAATYQLELIVNDNWFTRNPEGYETVSKKFFGPIEHTYGKRTGTWTTQTGDVYYTAHGLTLEQAQELVTRYSEMFPPELEGSHSIHVTSSHYWTEKETQ